MHRLAAVAIILALLIQSGSVFALSCAQPSLDELFDASDDVIIGKVTGSRSADDDETFEIDFRVKETLKGDLRESVTLSGTSSIWSSPQSFGTAFSYLIFFE